MTHEYSIMGPWRQGELLKTWQTRHWSPEQQAHGDAIEKTMVFAKFRAEDEGRAREKVCIVPPGPQAAATARLIATTPELVEALFLERMARQRPGQSPFDHEIDGKPCGFCTDCRTGIFANTERLLAYLDPSIMGLGTGHVTTPGRPGPSDSR